MTGGREALEGALGVWHSIADLIENADRSTLDMAGMAAALEMLPVQRNALRAACAAVLTEHELARMDAAADRLERTIRAAVGN